MNVFTLEKSIKVFIKKHFPKVNEEKKYGGVLYSSKGHEHFCGVFSYKTHVSVEFPFGYQLNDPKKLLHGSGKYRRHLKYKNETEISLPDLKKFLKEAYKISKSQIF